MYVAECPRKPWTPRFGLKGWEHPDARPLKICFKTIREMHPAIWLCELPHAPRSGAGAPDPIEEIQKYAAHQLGDSYSMKVASGIDPNVVWFPD